MVEDKFGYYAYPPFMGLTQKVLKVPKGPVPGINIIIVCNCIRPLKSPMPLPLLSKKVLTCSSYIIASLYHNGSSSKKDSFFGIQLTFLIHSNETA